MPKPTTFAEERELSAAATSANAHVVHDAGHSGAGVKVAVLDSGIAVNASEFAGRIHAVSQDVVGNRGVGDTEGHGTQMAGLIAAARDASGIKGLAFGATLMAFKTSLLSCTSNSCPSDSMGLAKATDLARENGARIINLSIAGPATLAVWLEASRRAVQSGVVIVTAAGNHGGSQPLGTAREHAAIGEGHVIIAGAHDASRNMLPDSGRAGAEAAHFLVARGDLIYTIGKDGGLTLTGATSAAAAIISGSAALLMSAFPNLSGKEIVEILFKSADDAGAAGVDPVFGNGILNVGRAFQPIGATSMAGSLVPVSMLDNGRASAAMGDARGSLAGGLMLDGFSRAFTLDLGNTVSRAPSDQPFLRALHSGHHRSAAAGTRGFLLAITSRHKMLEAGIGAEYRRVSYRQEREQELVAGAALAKLTSRTAVALGFSESGRTLQQRFSGEHGDSFLIARDPLARAGFDANVGRSIGLRHDLGGASLTLTSESGFVFEPERQRAVEKDGYRMDATSLQGKRGRVSLALGGSRLREERTILGGRFSEAFSGGGSVSHFADAAAAFDFARGWGANASYRRGWTQVQSTGALVHRGRLSSDAFAIDLSRYGLIRSGDRFAFRVTQPLRVRSGGFDLNLPVSYDHRNGKVGHESRFFNLAPRGREIDFELAYGRRMFGGSLGLNAFLRRQPGHVQAMNSDVGAAISFRSGL